MANKKWISDIIIAFVHGLKQKPAYILIFGICMLFVIFGFGSGIYGYINNEIIALYLSFSSFVIALIVATIVSGETTSPTLTKTSPGKGNALIFVTVSNSLTFNPGV